MIGMTIGRKVKLSISLSSDVLAEVDREAKIRAEPRSVVIESWLRSAARRNAEASLASEVIAYYDALTADERREDARLAKSLTAAARRVEYRDEPASGRRGVAPSAAPRKRRR